MEIHEHLNSIRQSEKTAMVRATISRKIEDLIYTYPKITVARIFSSFFRKQDEIMGQPFDWGDERTLKKLESIEREFAENYNTNIGDWNPDPVSDEFILEMLSNKPHATN